MEVMQNINNDLWVLDDARPGNTSQVLGLAEAIGKGFTIKKIEYNFLAGLPSCLLRIFPGHVKYSIIYQLRHEKPPKLIIAAGRRSAALALYLKKIFSPEKVKILQIMHPGIDSAAFDLVILPQHDHLRYRKLNVLRVIGALSNIQQKIQDFQASFKAHYPTMMQYIVVLVGGSTKGYQFTLENTTLLCKVIDNISQHHVLPLFIICSRRTPKQVRTYIKSKFSLPNIIFDPEECDNQNYNPYPAVLNKAEYIIATNDSIAMCSEAVSTGKPVYIFCPKNFNLLKHKFFIQQLVDLNLAHRIASDTTSLAKYNYKPLAEAWKVVDVMKKRGLID